MRRLAELDTLSDLDMARELSSRQARSRLPHAPSVEAILHGVLPARFVDHTHADAFVTLSNTPSGAARIRELYGEDVLIVPYVMPGFALARSAWQLYREQAHANITGLALLGHGLFTFGDTAQESYERMIVMVNRAEEYLARHVTLPAAVPLTPPAPQLRQDIAALRRELSQVAGRPLLLMTHQDDAALAYAQRTDLSRAGGSGSRHSRSRPSDPPTANDRAGCGGLRAVHTLGVCVLLA